MNNSNSSWRFSTKSTSLRLSSKQKKPGAKKRKPNQLVQAVVQTESATRGTEMIYCLDETVFQSTSETRYTNETMTLRQQSTNQGVATADQPSNSTKNDVQTLTPVNPQKRLTLSNRRKRRIIPIGLVKWRIQQKKRKLSENETELDNNILAIGLKTPTTIPRVAGTIPARNILHDCDDDINEAEHIDVHNTILPNALKIIPGVAACLIPATNIEYRELPGTVTRSDEYERVRTAELDTNVRSTLSSQVTDEADILRAFPDRSLPPLRIEPLPNVCLNTDIIEKGNYIVDGLHFVNSLRNLELHRFSCLKSRDGYMKLLSSTTSTMIWKMEFQCPFCFATEVICSQVASGLTKTSSEEGETLLLAEKAVWGFASIGAGHENMEEVLTSMEIKSISPKSFRRTESKLGQLWCDNLFRSMRDAGIQERKMAVDNGDVNKEGVPYISVIVDGGWSHRSHGHRYTANSGVACVIGLRTRKLLDLGVRNKYCSMCEYKKRNNLDPSHENCFRNWDGPSASMETAMLVEAFQRSKQLHDLEYHTVIGDGDSSVFYNLKTLVSYGRSIEKVECANHAVKNYTKRLYNLRKQPQYKKLFPPTIIKRLKTAARGAIIQNSKSGDVKELKLDLINGPHHVFGDHAKCKSYFCRKQGEGKDLGREFTRACGTARSCLQPLLAKSAQLVSNNTSNAAENFMSLVAKFVGGKQINRGKRGSFTHRTKAAGLDYQLGPTWHYSTMKSHTKKSPALIVKKVGERRERRKISCRKSLFNMRSREKNRSTNEKPVTRQRENNGIQDYGVQAQEVDMDEDALNELMKDKMVKLSLPVDEISRLEMETRGQRENDRWFESRKDRLTASNFGYVCKKRKQDNTKWDCFVKNILCDTFIQSSAMQYGCENEHLAVECFQEKTGLSVKPCGFFVHPEYGYLGASPDGLIGEDAILEVKCPSSAKAMSIGEAIAKIKTFCIDKKTNSLKKTHNYYYQVQGQLQVTGRQKCYFVVWTPRDLHIEVVTKDNKFWAEKMLKNLKFCYEEVLLKEIIDPRVTRSLPVRKPNLSQLPV